MKRTPHRLETTAPDGTLQGAGITASDLRWLERHLRRMLRKAERAYPSDHVHLRLTTSEATRATRLLATLAAASELVPRGTRAQP